MTNIGSLNTSDNANQMIHHLSGETTRLISSSQIVTSVSSVVKELFENSLDANALNIQVKLENFGLDYIEVKDDGFGISYENVQKMFLPGFTSKINDFSDLDKLTTYGFRGEALGAVCQLGTTSVTTKREEDALAMTYNIDKNGEPSLSFPSHLPKGTTISVKNLFKDLPVRKQYASSKKKMSDELKKVENVVQSLSVIHPQLRVVLTHNKSSIWQKNAVKTLKQSFMQVVGLRHASKMDVLSGTHCNVSFDLVLPKKDVSDANTLFSSNVSNSFVFVNRRPIVSREISKVIDEICGTHWNISDQHVLFLLALAVPTEDVDVNLEPNKSKVLLKNMSEVLLILSESIQRYYGIIMQGHHRESEESEIPSKKMRLDSSAVEDDEEKVNDITASDEMSAICSQVNRKNCILASEQEVANLNHKLLNNGKNIITNFEVVRDDIQQRKVFPKNLEMTDSFNDERNKYLDSLKEHGKNSNDVELPIIEINDKKTPYKMQQSISAETKVSSPFQVGFGAHVYQGSLERINILPDGSHKNVIANYPHTDFQTNQMPNSCKVVLPLGNTRSVSAPDAVSNSSAQTDVDCELSATKDVIIERTIGDSNFEINVSDSTASKMTKDSWSRGQVVLENGKHLDSGVVLLTNNNKFHNSKGVTADSLSNHVKAPAGSKEDVLVEDVSKFNMSLESVSSQMGKKELSGFTKYTRIMRPKIIAENPNILFTEVSRKLVERWKSLSVDEREYYESVAKAVDEERKVHRQQVAVPSKQTSVLPFKQLKRPPRRKTQMSINYTEILNLRKMQSYCKRKTDEHKLLGPLLDTDIWLSIKNGNIWGIRHTGLSELVMFHKMMANFKIATQKLDKHEYLNPSTLGEQNWNCLLSLETKYESAISRHVITSPVVDKNGFRVEIIQPEDISRSTAILTETAIEIEQYGINELKEALELYQEHGDFATLDKLRPAVARHYIEADVKNAVKSNTLSPDRDAMTQQLITWQQSLRHLPAQCLHGRDIFVSIHSIQSL